MSDKRIVSIKGDSMAWRGMFRESRMSLGVGDFRLLENCYVSKEGNEIRRFPGWRLAVKPDYQTYPYDWATFKSTGSGTQANRRDVAFAFEQIRGAILIIGRDKVETATDGIHLMSGGGAPYDLNPPQIALEYSASGVAPYAYAEEKSLCGWMVPNRPDVGAPPGANDWGWRSAAWQNDWATANETFYLEIANRHGHNYEFLGFGNGGTSGKITACTNSVSAGGPWNGHADWTTITMDRNHGLAVTGTTPGTDYNVHHGIWIWDVGSTTANALDGYHEILAVPAANTLIVACPAAVVAQSNQTGGYRFARKRDERPLDHRPAIDHAGDRIIAAVPQYACCFQFPMGLLGTPELVTGTTDEEHELRDGLAFRPRCLGVPKAILIEDECTVASGPNSAAPYLSSSMAVGDYYIRVAYRDDRTGEIGIASEAVRVNSVGVNGAIDFCALLPGQTMSECLAGTLMVYGSETVASGGSENVMGLVMTIPLNEGSCMTGSTAGEGNPATRVYANVHWGGGTSPSIDYENLPRIIEQMPKGAKAVRTVRGFTFFGGVYGNAGDDFQLWKRYVDKINTGYVGVDDKKIIMNAPIEPAAYPDDGDFGNVMVAGLPIPPAYAGSLMHGGLLFYHLSTLGGSAMQRSIRLDYMANIELNHHWMMLHEWMLAELVPMASSRKSDGSIEPERGALYFSEAAHPGVVPADNRIHLDTERDESIEAIGSYRDMAVICTRTQTHGVAFSSNPKGGQRVLLSAEHGCNAPNSMVEFDGGLAWMSSRGPVALIGGRVQWIGAPLADYFVGENASMLKDGKGLMSYSWGCHDPERGLVYFGVNDTDYNWSEGPLQADELSMKPCNTVLIWSYRANAWSLWRPPATLEVMWMRRVLCNDDVWRVCFLADDGNIYALDDAVCDNRKSGSNDTSRGVAEFTTATEPQAGEFCLATTGSMSNEDDPLHPFWRVGVGMEWVLTDSTGTFKEKGTVTSRTLRTITSNYDCLDLGVITTHVVGDVLTVGGITMTLDATHQNFGGEGHPKRIGGVVLRHDFETNNASPLTTPSVGRPIVHGRITVGNRDSVDVVLGTQVVCSLSSRDGTYAATKDFNHRSIFTAGDARGHEHGLKVEIFGGQQTRLENIELEMRAAGGG